VCPTDLGDVFVRDNNYLIAGVPRR
jgi:hypothetical protein